MTGTYSKNVIEMELLMATKGSKDFDNGIRKIPEIEAKTRRYNKILKEHNMNQAEADKVLNRAGLRIDKNGNVVDRAGKIQRNYNKSIKNNVSALAKFKMEQLGIMFAGMALNRAMTNLNATSREWLGIGELTSTMMGVTMLSANMDLLEYGVLPLFDALTNLPEGAQKAIGYVSFALEGLGKTMMAGGQLMLGMDSTATLLSKIAGVKPDLIFTSTGLSALSTRLVPLMSKLKTIGKYAATGIAISFAIKDLEKGKILSAIGDSMVAAGFYFENGWLLGAGIVLKLADSDYLGKIAVDFFDTVGYMSEWASDTLSKALSLDAKDIDWSGATEFFDKMDTYAAKKVLSGDAKSAALINRMGGVQGAFDTLSKSQAKEIQGLQDKYDLGVIPSQEELNKQIEEAKGKYEILNTVSLPNMEDHYDKIKKRGSDILSNLAKIAIKMSSIAGGGSIPNSFTNSLLGNKAVGGTIRKTGPYYLHEGEMVTSKSDNNGSVIINATYNVTVSDKREFEQMLRKNNESITSQVRRMVKV